MGATHYPLGTVRSHVDHTDDQGLVFSRDCPEFEVSTPGGHRLVLVNHLKSKGYGSQAANNARRQRQAQRVAEIYRRLLKKASPTSQSWATSTTPPTSAPLAPLLTGADLRDISTHPHFDLGAGRRPGTFGAMTAGNRIDYIFLSPALLRDGHRRRVRAPRWPLFDSLTKATDAASDHAAVYADLTLT